MSIPPPSDTISPSTKAEFTQYLIDNPNKRRVSRNDQDELLQWLTNPKSRPSSQTEFSRRNYVQKTFKWDEAHQRLLVLPKEDGGTPREAVIHDRIADIVGCVHEENGHAGWDTTWKDVSKSFYGILRVDVIFLLKRCETCRQDPRKRPKHSSTPNLQFEQHFVRDAVPFEALAHPSPHTWETLDDNGILF